MTERLECSPPKRAIVFSMNDRFVTPARTAIESIHRHSGGMDGVSVVVMTTGLSASSEQALEESAARARLPLEIRRVGDTSELGSIPDWAIETCLRLFVGEVCSDFERVLYLDCDLLVLDDLGALIDVDLGQRCAAAVVNYPPLDVIRVAIPRSRRGAVDGDAPYFNAAVLVVDVGRWKERSVGERSRSFIRCFPTTRLLDQDALNVALENDWHSLDKEWNTPAGPLDEAPMFRGLAMMSPSMTATIDQWKRAQRSPKVLHFTGHPKPWEPDYPWSDLREQFNEYVLPTFGADWPAARPDAIANARYGEKAREFRRA